MLATVRRPLTHIKRPLPGAARTMRDDQPWKRSARKRARGEANMFAVMFDWADVPYQNAAKPPYGDSRAQLLGLRSMRRACY